MDELLIDDRKYVSSKQAAKITGYAKDYIGQLCREGRVPARLVGRSWYVLESAIRDHRFGTHEMSTSQKTEQKIERKVASPTANRANMDWVWDAPRYEAIVPDELPIICKSQPLESANIASQETSEEDVNREKTLHDTWRAWFDRIAETTPKTDEKIEEKTDVVQLGDETPKLDKMAYEDRDSVETEDYVVVPINAIYAPPKEEVKEKFESEHIEFKTNDNWREAQPIMPLKKRRGINTVAKISTLLAIISLVIAIANSGYVDHLIIPIKQAHSISGISVSDNY